MQMPSDPQEIPARRNRKNTKENAQAVAARDSQCRAVCQGNGRAAAEDLPHSTDESSGKREKGGGDSDAHLRATALKAGADTSELWSRGACHQCKLWSVRDPV